MSIFFVVANKDGNKGVSVVGDKYFTDCTINISHTFNNSVTEHPVETKSNITDHVQVQNNSFTVSGVFTNLQLLKYNGDSFSAAVTRVQAAYDFLKGLRDNATQFTLVSQFDVYPKCVVESLTIPVSAENFGNLYFDINIKQIRTASVETVRLSAVATPIKDSASGTTNDGKKAATQVRTSSALDDFFDIPKDILGYLTPEPFEDTPETPTGG